MNSNTRTQPAQRVAALLAFALPLGVAQAQARWVFVNGQRLNDALTASLERANCLSIPNRAYWLNAQNGDGYYVRVSR